MRKFVMTLAALAAFGIAMPAVSNTANAETVIIKKHRDHGWHHGWRHRDRDRVVVKERRYHRHHGATLREGHHGVGVVVR